jgi:hypothetical protein
MRAAGLVLVLERFCWDGLLDENDEYHLIHDPSDQGERGHGKHQFHRLQQLAVGPGVLRTGIDERLVDRRFTRAIEKILNANFGVKGSHELTRLATSCPCRPCRPCHPFRPCHPCLRRRRGDDHHRRLLSWAFDDDAIGRQQQNGHFGGVLQGGALDFGRRDDAGLDMSTYSPVRALKPSLSLDSITRRTTTRRWCRRFRRSGGGGRQGQANDLDAGGGIAFEF